MLLVKTSMAIIFDDTPKSLPCLMALTRSGPALASAMTSAPEAWASSSGDDMSAVPSGCFTSPTTDPPAAVTACRAAADSVLPKT